MSKNRDVVISGFPAHDNPIQLTPSNIAKTVSTLYGVLLAGMGALLVNRRIAKRSKPTTAFIKQLEKPPTTKQEIVTQAQARALLNEQKMEDLFDIVKTATLFKISPFLLIPTFVSRLGEVEDITDDALTSIKRFIANDPSIKKAHTLEDRLLSVSRFGFAADFIDNLADIKESFEYVVFSKIMREVFGVGINPLDDIFTIEGMNKFSKSDEYKNAVKELESNKAAVSQLEDISEQVKGEIKRGFEELEKAPTIERNVEGGKNIISGDVIDMPQTKEQRNRAAELDRKEALTRGITVAELKRTQKLEKAETQEEREALVAEFQRTAARKAEEVKEKRAEGLPTSSVTGQLFTAQPGGLDKVHHHDIETDRRF